MNNEENKKIQGYQNLLDEGFKLQSKTQILVNEYDPNKLHGMNEVNSSFEIVVQYHKWLKNVKQFMELNLKDKIETSVFNVIDSIPTLDWLDKHQHFNGDFISMELAENILKETKNKIKHLVEITRQEREKTHKEVKKNKFTTKKGDKIRHLELLLDKVETKKVRIYVNGAYKDHMDFNRRNYWIKMYDLARDQSTSYNRGFFAYFNSNINNPLYAKYNFKIGQILKKNAESIEPNIKINLINQKKVSQQLNSA